MIAMPIYKGSTKIGVIKKGSTNIKKVFKGATLVFGKEVFEQTFTTSGSITFPASMYALAIEIVGAGGSGGALIIGTHGDWIGGGGAGAGGYCQKDYTAVEIQNLKGKTVSFTIGGVSKGDDGGNTTILGLVAYGGKRGQSAGEGQGGGVGGTASGGITNKQGGNGTNGGYLSVGRGATGWTIGGTVYGDGGDAQAVGNDGLGKAGCIHIIYFY